MSYRNIRERINAALILVNFIFITLLNIENAAAVLSTYNVCGDDQFTCSDNTCIPREKVCNGHIDCADNSDEIDCELKMCHKPNWFQCSVSKSPCLSSDLVCNGIVNCPSGEDEMNCVDDGISHSSDIGTGGWHSGRRNCSSYEYTCQGDKSCIPLDFMCDGKNDCMDNSDETVGCLKAQTSCAGFFCANKKCLESKKWKCDGVDDCGDNSDELNCGFSCTFEVGKFLCNDKRTCIEANKTCDGHKDCLDGSDESDQCEKLKSQCDTKNCPAASVCRIVPTRGAQCICPKGFRFSSEKNICVDINECEENHGACSQNCENLSGDYRCTCDENYTLMADKRTCRAHGEEALLLYTTQSTIMGVHLRSHRVFTVAANLTKVIGVSYYKDGIYWTNIQNEAESIVRSNVDGSHQEILLTSGLDAPEDLAVDWLTGNIYFSDNVMRHIAVCSNDGLSCNVLVTIDVHQPRGIALWPQRGQMFWTDWGDNPMIARASMDGSNSVPIISSNIHWPNGIALDMHNSRIYWVDAKLGSVESARPDGTDRRIVIDEILKHPYGLAIFEEKLYWSDWATRSIHSCNKFTGKGHQVIAKDRTIYAVHIYHSAKQPKIDHACLHAHCSHMCLLAENNRSTCACPDGMQLSNDQARCIKVQKKQRLFMGLQNTLLEMEHTNFGRHIIKQTHRLPLFISDMVYNNVNGSLIIADNYQHGIFEYDIANGKLHTLVSGNIGNITGLAFDDYAHNVYWSDSERHAIEALSLTTRQRAIVSFFSGMERPIGLAVIPEIGKMFVALRSRRRIHIDQKSMSGQGQQTHVFEDDLGDDDIKFAVDPETKTLYWSDSDLGRISFANYHDLHPYTFRGRLKRPFSLALVDEDLFWSDLKSSFVHWTHKSNMGPGKQIEIEMAKGSVAHSIPIRIPLAASQSPRAADHPCQHNNGGCSHVCVNNGRFSSVCLCPPGMMFRDSQNRTCIEALDCEFRCRSGECLTLSRRCNNHRDCTDGSDEENCNPEHKKTQPVICTRGEFSCHNGQQCISNLKRCDGKQDCRDGTDEDHCEKFDKTKRCHQYQHVCDNGHCVDLSEVCDGNNDCGDNSDEKNCKTHDKGTETVQSCSDGMFQCNSGTCISKNWECDGKIDCTDASDEHDKCGVRECPDKMHKCFLGQCIDERLVCDGHNDCGDLSDEVNCDLVAGKKLNKPCGDARNPKYRCPSNPNICIDLSAKCNRTAECPRGEDEADCVGICSIYEFKCANGECVRMEFRCDREKDCSDGSDEHNCEHSQKNRTSIYDTHERACEPHMFDCHDGRCIDMSRVCDGFTDCESGVDESTQCQTACRSTGNKPVCQHKCHPMPTGATCSCFHGYKLDVDHRSCLDINECSESDPCAQICENNYGSYRCSCYPEFMLRTDKTTCKSIESNSTLMFTTNNEVRSMSEHPVMVKVAWSANDSRIMGFDLNVRERRAYFTTDSEDILYMADSQDGSIKAALSVEMPTKVSVDWITGNVYVVSRGQTHHSIKICSFKKKMCGSIVKTVAHESIKTVNIDAYNRRLFFVILRPQAFGYPQSQITVSRPDGKKREILLNKKPGHITSLATDPYKKMLYFVDSHAKVLQGISYKTGSTSTPITFVQKGGHILNPTGLAIYEDHAFVVNLGSKEAVRCQLFGAKKCRGFSLNVLNAEDINVNGASRQPLAKNPCLMAKCSGMCLLSDYSFECMCGDAIVSEKAPCHKSFSNDIVSSALLAQPSDSSSSHHSHIIIIVFFVALLASAIGYLYYRSRKQGLQRNTNISTHFQNRLYSEATTMQFGKSSTLESNETSTTTTTSFENKTDNHDGQVVPIPRPLHRFFSGNEKTSGKSTGSEIVFEAPPAKPNRIHSLVSKCTNSSAKEYEPQLLVDNDDADDDSATNGNFLGDDDDDGTAKLVP